MAIFFSIWKKATFVVWFGFLLWIKLLSEYVIQFGICSIFNYKYCKNLYYIGSNEKSVLPSLARTGGKIQLQKKKVIPVSRIF
jgi:hypothetical protein